MADGTGIEWTRGDDGRRGATWNPIAGCTIVSPGCTNCYAMREAGNRLVGQPKYAGLTDHSNAGPVWNGTVRFWEPVLDQPLRWRTPRRIFVNSMSDLWHEKVEETWIDQIFAVAALCPQHVFQILTKRAEGMQRYLASNMTPGRVWSRIGEIGHQAGLKEDRIKAAMDLLANWPLPNVWVGISAEDQRRADGRIPHLLSAPAAIRFVSLEPLLGPIDLTTITFRGERGGDEEWNALSANLAPGETVSWNTRILDWVITGGESGGGARPSHPDWFRSIRDQCIAAGVAYFHKQWGEWLPGEVYRTGDQGGFVRHQDGTEGSHKGLRDHWWSGDAFGGVISTRVGKDAAGRLLDGREWNQFPKVAA